MTDKIMGTIAVILGLAFTIFITWLIAWSINDQPHPSMPAGVCVLTSTDFNSQTIATITPGHLRNGVIVCDAGNWVSTTPIVSK